MTIKELKEKYAGQYYDFEVYKNFNSSNYGFHTDRIKAVDDYSDADEVIEWQLMDKEDYSNSILANVCTTWEDFGFEEDDKILVVKIK